MTLSWMQGLDDGRILYSTYIEALLQALNGKYVLSGLSCSTDGASLNVNIEAGTVRYDGVDYNYAGGSVTLNIGEVDRDRVDVIVWDYNGGSPTISVLQGSRWLNIGGSLKPMSERISDTQIPLALVIVRAGATSIGVTDVYDVRVTADMVAKLSDLQIDADKDWNGKSIYNVNEITTTGNVNVGGDLVVNGTTTTVDSQNLVVQDNEITLNNGEAGAGVTSGTAGIRIDRGTEIDARLIWDETTDKWKAGIEGSEEDIILRTEFDTHTHTRSEVTDFFSSPFWANIPDKPFANVGSEFQVVGNELQVSGIDASKVTSGVFDVARIPNLPRGKISGFFATPFWNNIPDKPSSFPPSAHASSHGPGGSDRLSLDASQITSGVFDVARIPNLPRGKISGFFATPFWANIPDKPSTFPSALSRLTIDVDKWWGTKKIMGLGGLWLVATTGFPSKRGGFIAWNYPSGTGATVFFNHHGTGNTEYIFYSTTDWSNFRELLRITNLSAQFNVHTMPKTDNTYLLGSSNLRWRGLYATNVHATNVYQGDLCFIEKECAVCGQPFKEGDEIVLKVNKIEDEGTHTIPIHLKCSNDYKELEERIRKLEAGV